MYPSNHSAPARFGVAVLSAAFSTALRTSFAPLWGTKLPYITFFPAVFISAWYGGLWPGLLATALSGLAALFFLLPPPMVFGIESLSDQFGFILFIINLLLITFLTDALHRMRSRSEETHRRMLETSKQYHRLVEIAAEGVWEVDADWRTVYANQQMAQMLGYSVEELIGKRASDLCFEEDRAAMDQIIAESRRGQTGNGEIRLRRRDGSELWARVNMRPIPDQGGGHTGAYSGESQAESQGESQGEYSADYPVEYIGALSMVTDISSRKRAERRLQLLSATSETLSASLEIEIVLQNLAQLCVPAIADQCIVDIVNEEGIPELVAIAHSDPTHEVKLRELRRRYPPNPGRPSALWTAIRENRPALLTGITEELPKTVAENDEHLAMALELKITCAVVAPLTAQGHTFGALSLAMVDSGRELDGEDLAFTVDLANRAAVAINNARLFAQVQEASRRKDEFLAMLSHELRNPMAAILGAHRAAQILDAKKDEAARTQVQAILDRQIAHLSGLVDDLLDVSRITRGKISLKLEFVELVRLASEACADLRDLAERAGLSLNFECSWPPESSVVGPETRPEMRPESWPELRPELWVNGDRLRLAQMLTNLITNAIKFTNVGGRITVKIRAVGERVAVSVRDTGIGIDPQLIGRIFDTFTQGERTLDRSQGGLGLGLALVKGLAELHGGDVRAHSDGPGRGSEFTFSLPLSPAPASGAPASGDVVVGRALFEKDVAATGAKSQRRSQDLSSLDRFTRIEALNGGEVVEVAEAVAPIRLPGATSAPMKVVVIDDNQDSADMACMMLQLYGHTTEAAYSGARGLEAVERLQPDAVCCDIGLPEMDGYAVARELRRRGYGGLLIAVSGYGQEEDKKLSREAGFDSHLVKPIESDFLDQELQGLARRTDE